MNILFTTLPVPFDQNPALGNEFRKIADWVSPLPESKIVNGRILVQGTVGGLQQVEIIHQTLTAMGFTPSIIGAWNNDGTQVGYHKVNIGTEEEPVWEVQRDTENYETVPYPFNITEYTTSLKDVIDSVDEQGNVTSHTPTETEARTIQVNRFAGMPDRDLKSYV